MCCNCNSQGHPWWKEQAKTNPLSPTVCQKPTVNNYCTNSATILGAILNYVLHLHLNFSSLFNVARQLSRSTVLGNICFRQDEKWVRIALSGESEVHTAEEELNFAQSKRTETEAHKFIYFLWFHNKKMKPEVMPFCHRFSANYGSLVTLCCLARSVYSYRNSANSMSPFSLHRHPSILAYLTMPCGFAIHVLYTELSTYAYFEEEKNPVEMHSSYTGNRIGCFRPGLKIFHHDSVYLFYVFMRPEIRIVELKSRTLWNATFEEQSWNCFLSKPWLFQTLCFETD